MEAFANFAFWRRILPLREQARQSLLSTRPALHRALALRTRIVWSGNSGLMVCAAMADGGFNAATVVPPPVTTSSDIEVAASSTRKR